MMFLRHYTLNSGHTRFSPRSEVNGETIALLKPLTQPGRHLVPITNWILEMAINPEGWAIFTVYGEAREKPAIQCCLAWTDAGQDTVWPLLVCAHQALFPGQFPNRPAGLPWLATSILPGFVMLGREAQMAMANFERCLSWAILVQNL